jgi:hypothetical protein
MIGSRWLFSREDVPIYPLDNNLDKLLPLGGSAILFANRKATRTVSLNRYMHSQVLVASWIECVLRGRETRRSRRKVGAILYVCEVMV